VRYTLANMSATLGVADYEGEVVHHIDCDKSYQPSYKATRTACWGSTTQPPTSDLLPIDFPGDRGAAC